MVRALLSAFTVACFSAGLCHGADRIEIVLDTSAGMWKPFQTGISRIVAIRSALSSFISSPAVRDMELEIGLRTIGGRHDFVEDLGCSDSSVAVNRGPVGFSVWSSALAELDPRGGRALVHAIEEAARDLSNLGVESRIVVITSGDDQCRRDIGFALERLSQADNPISVRIIGLDIEHALASSLVLHAPTRNVTDPAKLADTLRWSMLPEGVVPTRAEWLELHLSHGESPLTAATLHLANPFNDEVFTTAIEEGSARIRLAPGRYWAIVEDADHGAIELGEIMHLGRDTPVEVPLLDCPEVTLEVVPARPSAGDVAHVQYWGAPMGTNWIAIAPSGAPPGEYLERAPAAESWGEAGVRLPDSPNELDVQFIHESDSGIQQVLGRIEFETARRRVVIDAPAQAENSTQMTIGWSSAELDGDHITIAVKGGDTTEGLYCAPATGDGPVSVTTPAAAGEYVIHYLSRRGRVLAGADLEVFEILATLDGPTEVGPGQSFNVGWTGPDEEQDFLSIAAVGDSDDRYRSFSPASVGSPARLTAPGETGDYEVRYVRGTDGEVLAREQFAVNTVKIALDVPPVVDAGTRFETAWTGTAREGDFIAVAKLRWGPKRHLDWSYTNLGSPVSLAAPFDAGRYVVRYVSGETQKIIARAEIEVR